MTKPWSELADRFRKYVFQRSITEVAEEIPADKVTVYRIIKGETSHPCRAVVARIESMIDAEEKSNE